MSKTKKPIDDTPINPAVIDERGPTTEWGRRTAFEVGDTGRITALQGPVEGQWLAELSPIGKAEPQKNSTGTGTLPDFAGQRVRLTLSKSLAPAWTLPGYVPRRHR